MFVVAGSSDVDDKEKLLVVCISEFVIEEEEPIELVKIVDGSKVIVVFSSPVTESAVLVTRISEAVYVIVVMVMSDEENVDDKVKLPLVKNSELVMEETETIELVTAVDDS